MSELREETMASSGPEEAERRAVDAALNFLSYRQRTVWEVRRKLASRGFSQATIQAAIERLNSVRLVDDEAFVSAYVRDRIAHRPMGVRRMTQELYAKGVSRDLAARVIAEVLGNEETDERELAARVVSKKRRTLASRSEDPAISRRRLRDHLIRRGFDMRVVSEAIDALETDGSVEPVE